MRSAVARLLGVHQRVLNIGARPGDERDERLRKQTLAATGALISVIAPIYSLLYLLLDRPAAAAFPGLYWVASLLALGHFWRSGDYGVLRLQQVSMMLVLPFGVQWALGGFESSSAVMIFAFIAPAGALVWYGPRRAGLWFGAYIALTVVSGIIDPLVAAGARPLAADLRLFFFVLNIGTLSLVTYFVLQFFVGGRERALRELNIAHAELSAEQDRSERLLRNVLPETIAERLKSGEQLIADDHAAVTVLFADVANFSPFARLADAGEVISVLDRLFSAFDALAEECGLEKIKTIGDAYMAVAGVPEPRPDHADAAARMALGMLDEMDRFRAQTGRPLELRVGLHSGHVVAGVIGRRKFAYDLWGDAVNVASRMESHGVAGRIHVSEAVAQALGGEYALEERGAVEIKGLGSMQTYFLSRAAA